MALSPPPPPPPPPPSDPPSTTTTTTTTTTNNTIPFFPYPTIPPTPNPHPTTTTTTTTIPFFPYPTHNPNPNPNTNTKPQNILYPVASSGRGFYPNRPVLDYPMPRQPHGLSRVDPGSVSGQGVRQTLFQFGSTPIANSAATGGVLPGVVKGVPVVSSSHLKIAPSQPSIIDCNGLRNGRDRNKDDTMAIIRDRKVRISDKASIYALCRSWLRNGVPDEPQSQSMDGVRSLPRPLPLAPQDAKSPVKKEGVDEEEDESSIEHLSSKELLQRHVKRAKKIRSQLREERLRRIARYKTRLALLLPPVVEQQFRNDGN